MRASALLLAAATLLPAGGLHAQSMTDLVGALRQGGGWINLPVERGEVKLTTTPVPTAGMEIAGCLQIWPGHSGTWTMRIEDTYGNGRIDTQARPAQHVPFTYATGMWSQLDVNVRWSEPRDTTLIVWVGLQSARVERDPCEPVYDAGR